MKILADQNMPLVEQFFSDFGDVERFDGRSLQPEQLVDVDVLLTRSVTQVNKALLAQANKLKMVGTATIGVDHIDTPLLKQRGIAFTSAPGCNAVAVAEYVISSIFALCQENAVALKGKTIGIVGVGSIGSCLRKKLSVLDVNVLLCDPPKHEQGLLDEHTELDTLLKHSDIVTFHVPLVKTGHYKTQHLMDKARLNTLKKDCILINASRGDVIDNHALLEVMQQGHSLDLVLDVWENEPNILIPLLEYTRFASVHIAGHTLEGKARGTQMLYQKWCELENISAVKNLADFLPVPAITQVTLEDTFNEANLGQLIHLVYDVRRDDAILRKNLASTGFDTLRKNYPIRREFSTVRVSGTKKQSQLLAGLGFNI
ncbi:4-phosphoerythronate dehydrogenase [Pseudoalteromonas sp. MMG010]|uniref:4-phosphoerythronate dehydrogenase n=1 Tax=Pseudoalteromonas sp. MMG010 TaxID=2822685 RepID=UPI001B3A7308|nr:4-phosphoerythronate dehydrogenase [Pseudoalteromonas sp. MMG010]MBQ4831869.1 4-phosphoerythronate dehydrogenase [Pseudoalteromonas sp. MMG010]